MNIESKSMPAEVVEIHIAGDYDKARIFVAIGAKNFRAA